MRSNERRWSVTVLVAVAALHLAFLVSTRRDLVFRVPYLDGAFYHSWARSLAEGRGDFHGPYFLGPLYPWFMSIVYRLLGAEVLAVREVQCALVVLDAALVLNLGRRLFGLAAGCAAALVFALYGPLVFYENLLVMETLLLTLVLGALYVLLVPRWNASWRGALAGALLGLATLARPTVVLVAPFVGMALWRGRPDGTDGSTPQSLGRGNARPTRTMIPPPVRWRAIASCTLAWLVVLLPTLVRNARLGGGLVLTTNGGVNFYAGNAPGANGRFHQPPNIQFFTRPMLDKSAGADSASSLPTAIAARALDVESVAGDSTAADSGLWMARARSWIRSHPGDYIGLELRKLWLVLQAREVAQLEGFAFHRQRLRALRLFCVDFTWIWPLAALALWRARRDRVRGAGIVAGVAAALLLTCIVFFVTERYRLAALPEVAILAGAGAATLGGWIARRDVRRIAVALVALAPLAVATRLGAAQPRGAAGWEWAQMAERLYADGDLDGAIHDQERAAAAAPERLEIQLNLALYWSERNRAGDLQRAERLLLDLARRAPQVPLVLFDLGSVYEQHGRIEEAVTLWRRIPTFEPARERLQKYGVAP